jgi:hypothetical protein
MELTTTESDYPGDRPGPPDPGANERPSQDPSRDEVPEWLSKPGPDRPRVDGGSTRAQWAFDPKLKKLVKLDKQKTLLNMKINLGSPLLVKTKTGEVQAGPGDIVGEWGRHQVMMSKDMFIALLGEEEYDDLLRKEMMKIIVAKRQDDGAPPYSEEQLNKRRAEVDKVIEAKHASEQDIDPNDINQRIQIVDSGEGPPTIAPDEYGTIIPGPMLPIPVNMPENPDGGGGEESQDATGAASGSPGTFTPANATPPPDLASLSSLTADPTTAWVGGEYVVLGDGSEAHWNGTAWVVGRAPISGMTAQTSNPFQH